MSPYKIHLYSTPLPLPLNFFVHCYFVSKHNGIVHRHEVIGNERPDHPAIRSGFLFQDYLPAEQGFSMCAKALCHGRGPRFGVQHIGYCAGEADSPAHQLYTLLTTDAVYACPAVYHYKMIQGPNSNTFAQWVIDQVPDCGLQLPFTAWGKGV